MDKLLALSMNHILLTALALTSILPLSIISVKADNVNPGVYSKDSSPFGIPYSEWIHRWWQWNQGMPASIHPRDNFTEQKCTSNQNGPVWFLPDILTGKEERTCKIPGGKAIIVPLLTGECHNDGTPPVLNDDELHSCAKEGDEFGVLTATLDGRNIQNLDSYRTQTGFYNLTVVKGNIFDNLPGTFKGNADGFFVFLEPPSVGKHELRLTTSVTNPTTPSYNYAAEVLYHLIVSPKSQTETNNNQTNQTTTATKNPENASFLLATADSVTIVAGSSSPKNENHFVPPVLYTKEGTTVTWTNEDSALHTVVSRTHAEGSSFPEFDSEYIGPNDTFKYTFDTAGTFDYYCVLHPFMKGKVVVQ